MNQLQVRQQLSEKGSSPLTRDAASNFPQSRSPEPGIITQLSVSSIVPYARYGAQKIGPAGIVGLSLCIFSIVAFLSANGPLRESIATQESALEGARVAAGNQRVSRDRNDPAADVRQLVSQLPSRNDLPQILGQIVTVAAAAGLSLERGSYEFTTTESGSISRYQLDLPVRGSYPQVRQFVENTLATVPVVALESMRVERNDVSNQSISAELQFAVLVGSGR